MSTLHADIPTAAAAAVATATRPRPMIAIAVGDTFITFAWAARSPAPFELAFQIKRVYGTRAGDPAPTWEDALRTPLAPTATQHDATGLACQETYEARLVWRDAPGAEWVDGQPAAFDTLPAGCGPKKRKGGCAIT